LLSNATLATGAVNFAERYFADKGKKGELWRRD
jgi:hypothetical protein